MLFPVTATPSHTNSHRSFHSTLRSALNFHQSLGFLFQGFWNAVCDIGFYTTYTSFFFRVSGTLSAISASTRPTRLSFSGFLERCLRYRLLHDLHGFLFQGFWNAVCDIGFYTTYRCRLRRLSCFPAARSFCVAPSFTTVTRVGCCARLSFMSLCRLKS